MALARRQYSILLALARRQYSILLALARRQYSILLEPARRQYSILLARAFSVYTGWCWLQVWVESWVVKFWHECLVYTLGGVSYKFGLSLGW